MPNIQVQMDRERPMQFWWRGRWHQISRIEDFWLDAGEWWQGEGEKAFYRVIAGGAVYELYYDRKDNVWGMYRVYD